MTNPATSSLFSDLLERLAASLVLAAIATFTLWFGGWVFMLFVAAVVAVSCWEWARLVRDETGMTDQAILGMAGAGILVPFLYALWPPLGLIGVPAALVSVFILNDKRLGPIAAAGFVILLIAALALLFLRDTGAGLVLWVIVAVIGVDAGGYFAGRAIGGPKLWPLVSPKKTWSGFGGGVLLAVIASVVAAFLMEANPFLFAFLALLIAVVALSGDLAESAVKRRFGVKDSGTILPGHGGLLDRFDGLSFAAIFVGGLVWLTPFARAVGAG